MVDISLWLSALAGMVFLDTIICAIYLKKLSESALELIVSVLIWVVANLLNSKSAIADFLSSNLVFRYVIIGVVAVTIGVMLYHVFKIVTRDANRTERHKDRRLKDGATPAKRERED